MEMQSLSHDYVYERFGKTFFIDKGNILSIIELKINLEEKTIKVEYVKISEVLAMFMGILNSLMALGIIGKITSDSVI